ncbi:MAG: permease [Clostridia bacterium]|nr:permease [Clostridia bacterium]
MFTVALYLLAAAATVISLTRDRKKTAKALRIASNSFLRILPDFGTVLALVGIMLTFLSPAIISAVLGRQSGLWGMLAAAVVGSTTLIPGFVAFPLAKSLLDCGAGVPQIAIFVSTLMMVGVVTAPLETKYFSKRVTFIRNGLSFLFSFLVAYVMGAIIR